MAAPFTGIGVALVTLFDDTKALDEKATADLAARLVDDGVSAVIVAGTTGEADTLEDDERRRLLEAVRARVDGVPVLAGTGGTWGGQAARRTAAAREAGADLALVLSPRRVPTPGPTTPRCRPRRRRGLPLLAAIHFPVVSAAGHPGRGACPSRRDRRQGRQRRRRAAAAAAAPPSCPHRRRSPYPGASSLLSFAGPLGCPGAILALANARPEQCAAAFAGDAEVQLALTADHLASSAISRPASRRWWPSGTGPPPCPGPADAGPGHSARTGSSTRTWPRWRRWSPGRPCGSRRWSRGGRRSRST